MFRVNFVRDGEVVFLESFKTRLEAETYAQIEEIASFEAEGGEFRIEEVE